MNDKQIGQTLVSLLFFVLLVVASLLFAHAAHAGDQFQVICQNNGPPFDQLTLTVDQEKLVVILQSRKGTFTFPMVASNVPSVRFRDNGGRIRALADVSKSFGRIGPSRMEYYSEDATQAWLYTCHFPSYY